MTDLIKNEAEFIRNCATDIETGEPLEDDQMVNMYVIDAHRIADLIDAVEERNKELTLQLLATSGQAADALDKLTKAVELALEECPFRAGTPKYDKWWHHRRATLAEIKGESHE